MKRRNDMWAVSPINFDHNATPVFFVNKTVWENERYRKIIEAAVRERFCYIVLDNWEHSQEAPVEAATLIVDSMYTYRNIIIPEINRIYNTNYKSNLD